MEEMTKAALLGVLQGITEFLPVSSSGHLELGKSILRLDQSSSESMSMTIVLHAATALSTVIVFRKEVAQILRSVLRFERSQESWFVFLIAVSMLPAAVIGILFDSQIESAFAGRLSLVGGTLIATGILLLIAERAKHTDKGLGLWQAVLIGCSQAVAILPGISRSGATIATGVILGIDRNQAARFSFLMVVPLIAGKILVDVVGGEFGASSSRSELAIGFVTALLTGMVACQWMIKLVQNCRLWWFSIYCATTGVIAFVCHYAF